MDELEIPSQDNPPAPDSGPGPGDTPPQTVSTVSIEEWMAADEPGLAEAPPRQSLADAQLLAVLEAIVYIAEEPLTVAQIAAALNQDADRIRSLVDRLVAEFDKPEHGVSVREVAGGYKMATKPEHHDAVRSFVKSLKVPLKLSLPALETLAVIAYKQPVTTPEIMEIRGVQGGGVLKTLLDRKLITEAGRKNVIGKPILYKTTKEFLIQFGLKDLSELPSLKEFEEIRRMAMADSEIPAGSPAAEQSELVLEAAGSVPETPAPDAEAAAPMPEAPGGEGSVAAPALETPALEGSAPTLEGAAPDVDGAAPMREAPAGEGSVAVLEAPASDGAALVREAPAAESSVAAQEAPASDGAAPMPEAPAGESSVAAQEAPASDGAAPMPEAPAGESSVAAQEAPASDGTALVREAPAGESSVAAQEAPASDGAAPMREAPAGEGSVVALEAPASEGAAPMREAPAGEGSVAVLASETPAAEASAPALETAAPHTPESQEN